MRSTSADARAALLPRSPVGRAGRTVAAILLLLGFASCGGGGGHTPVMTLVWDDAGSPSDAHLHAVSNEGWDVADWAE